MNAPSGVALVTGASSGIGAATALRLATAGWTVYGGARRVELIAALDGVRPIALDVADDASMVAAVDRVEAEAGRIDLLVNNAGYGAYGAIEEVPLADARAEFEVNVFGLARMTQLVLPGMRSRRGGAIVNISSMVGRFAAPLGGWYHASKYAVEALSDSLRQEVAPFDIRVVIIEPGAIATEWMGIAAHSALDASGGGPYAARAKGIAATFGGKGPFGRAAPPDLVARVVLRAVGARRPRTRYLVGPFARPVVYFRRFAPDRLFDWGYRTFMS